MSEKKFTGNVHESSPEDRRTVEYNELPLHPSRMTFRGRYDHVDAKLTELLSGDEPLSGTAIEVLDFAGGVLSFGSPTAHDMIDAFESRGCNVKITVVDKFVPDDLEPSYDNVEYKTTLDFVEGKYDIVRILRLIEHVPESTYREIRGKLADSLRDGGLLIVSQKSNYLKMTPEGSEERDLRYTIKIMQKREGKLVPVALLPDSQIPWVAPFGYSLDQSEDVGKYLRFREKVMNGTEEIHRMLDTQGFDYLVKRLNINRDEPIGLLDDDTLVVDFDKDKKGDLLGELYKNAKDVGKWFAG